MGKEAREREENVKDSNLGKAFASASWNHEKN